MINKMSPLKLVTFDITGTLLHFRTPIIEKYIEMGKKYGVTADYQHLNANFKTAWKTLNKEHPNFGKDTKLGWENWWNIFVQKTFTGYIQPEEQQKITAFTKEMIDFHTKKEAFRKQEGTDELLKYLQQNSITLGVISNYDPRLTQILEFMELKQYFQFVLVSYEVGYCKPDSRIFLEALKRGKCTHGAEAVHVGDDVELDFLGAKNAGLRAVLFRSDSKNLDEFQVDKNEIFEDFFKLKTHFEKLLAK